MREMSGSGWSGQMVAGTSRIMARDRPSAGGAWFAKVIKRLAAIRSSATGGTQHGGTRRGGTQHGRTRRGGLHRTRLRIGRMLAPVLALALVTPALAETLQDTPARAALVVDLSSGAALLEKNADERLPPASMLKLMTLYMVLDRKSVV